MANKYLPNRYSYFLHFEVLKSGNRPFPPSHCLRLGPDPRIFQRSKKTRFPFSLQIKPIRSRAGFQGQVNGLVTVKLAQQLQEFAEVENWPYKFDAWLFKMRTSMQVSCTLPTIDLT